MPTFACPHCGQILTENHLQSQRCPSCWSVFETSIASPAPENNLAPPDEPAAEADGLPDYPEPSLALESFGLEERQRLANHGEGWAVLALLLPLAVLAVALACRLGQLSEVGLSLLTIVATGLLLAQDASMLGDTDLSGRRRSGPGKIFTGIFLLWIICYPLAFFRRQAFGRPNLGPFALLVALLFCVLPYVHYRSGQAAAGSGPPACNSREVTTLLDEMVRETATAQVLFISDYQEVSYVPDLLKRRGQCQVETDAGTVTIFYTVKMLNPTTATFQVKLDPDSQEKLLSVDPPSCTDPQVIAFLREIIGNMHNINQLKAVEDHKEVRYDRAAKVRHGSCRVTAGAVTQEVAYKVYWIDWKKKRYQVEIEP